MMLCEAPQGITPKGILVRKERGVTCTHPAMERVLINDDFEMNVCGHHCRKLIELGWAVHIDALRKL